MHSICEYKIEIFFFSMGKLKISIQIANVAEYKPTRVQQQKQWNGKMYRSLRDEPSRYSLCKHNVICKKGNLRTYTYIYIFFNFPFQEIDKKSENEDDAVGVELNFNQFIRSLSSRNFFLLSYFIANKYKMKI